MAGYVELYNLSKIYQTPKGPAVIVEDFTLNMVKGEFTALLGHSGCGKSTVLTMIAGLNPISSGSVVIAGREIMGPGPDRGVVFQSPCLLPWMTAFENVMLGVHRVFPHASPKERAATVEYYMELVGLGDSMHKTPAALSLGMQQRVGLARAFAVCPNMLLLDEPFGMLDSLTRMELQEVLGRILEQDAKTTLMVTHDVDEALFLADRIVMMTNGPRARVGEVLVSPFERPRRRSDVLAHAEYYGLRERMIGFLEQQDRQRATSRQQARDDAREARTPGLEHRLPIGEIGGSADHGGPA